MAAVFPVYYLVRPNPSLLAFLSEHPHAKTLEAAKVVCQQQPFPVDHDYPGQTADCETFAKLCYLAGFERDRILSSNESVGASHYSELLGSAPMTVATFDRWWSLERVGLGFQDLDRLIEDVPVDVLKRIEGPRERSALAEEAAREQERRYAERRNAELDEVTGLPTSAVKLELPPWPSSVGTWWEDVIARRARDIES